MTLCAGSKSASIAIIAICQVAAMALWFSASAVVPALVAEFRLSGFAQAALTSGVQAGFVLGCLVSALFGLADRIDPRRLFAASACVGAAANALLLVVDAAGPGAPLLRLVTGACMAGIYPVGMKLASTWAKGDMGLMVGILVGRSRWLGVAASFQRAGRRRLAGPAGAGVDERPDRRNPHLCRRRRRIAHLRRASIRASWPRRGATSRCGSRTSDISVTCGSCTRCGRGSASSSTRASR